VTAVAYPLGEHGVLTLYADEVDVLDDRDGTLGRVLAANTEAVLDRLVGERALRRREAQLERQNERLERFASLVSHDLRSPLEVARGNVELATLADQDPAERLDKALTALDRADELIDDMLTFARQGQHVTEVSPVGIERVARAAWPAARTETDTDASGELVCDTDCRIRADESRLRQLLENLFRNALEHNDETVSVGVHETADGFAVTDDGTGLPSLSPQELFDPGTTTSEAGTGFGLSIVREIADAHGWTVSVGESETGGARFEFVTDPTA
jgi:signal transduction histidine kinase